MGSLYEDIRLPLDTRDTTRGSTRPYVLLNMVQSADGRTALQGKASTLGTDTDRSVMRTLRSRADAIMVGGGTVRAERLSLSLDAEDTRPVPRAIILTNTGDLPLESNLVWDHRQDVLVFISGGAEEGAERQLGRLAETRRVPAAESGAIDLAGALEIMKSTYGIDILLCEGGTTLKQALIGANLANELFVTMAPVLVGGSTPEEPRASLERRLMSPSRLHLISSQAVGDEIFLRYAIQRCF
jgi:2,5-diamino-6-(ribosylamino)-4(3H)-pyrimidinone 5'-phosphate reductase